MNYLQILLVLFLLFALSRVVLRYYDRQLKKKEFIFWAILFSAAVLGVIFPIATTEIAKFLGIGRGVDLITYAAIVVLSYLMFRAYVYIEDLRHEITKLVRKIALETEKK